MLLLFHVTSRQELCRQHMPRLGREQFAVVGLCCESWPGEVWDKLCWWHCQHLWGQQCCLMVGLQVGTGKVWDPQLNSGSGPSCTDFLVFSPFISCKGSLA